MDDQGVKKARAMFIKLALAIVIILVIFCSALFLIISRAGLGRLTGSSGTSDVTVTPSGIVGLTPTVIANAREWIQYTDRGYLFSLDYLSGWEIEYDSQYGDGVTFVAADESSLGVNWAQGNYASVEEYLVDRDMDSAVFVESKVEFTVDKNKIIQRKERIVEEDQLLVRNYMMQGEYIFIFTVYPTSNETLETNEIFRESLNVIGSFEFRTERFVVSGQIVKGENAGKSYCAQGYYLRIDGDYLQAGNNSLLLRSLTPGHGQDYPLFDNPAYLGRNVTIEGIYDREKSLCRALTCDCDDYLIIENIQ